MNTGRPRKHSLTLHQHQTSVSLEDEFWQAFTAIARLRGLSNNALACEIDDARGLDMGLATAIRLHVLRHYRARASEVEAPNRETP